MLLVAGTRDREQLEVKEICWSWGRERIDEREEQRSGETQGDRY